MRPNSPPTALVRWPPKGSEAPRHPQARWGEKRQAHRKAAQPDLDTALRRPFTRKAIRDKWHGPQTCKRHGTLHTAHPLSVFCFHPACVTAAIVSAAKREGRHRLALWLRRQGHWRDFIQFATLRILTTVRQDPLLKLLPWHGFNILLDHYLQSPGESVPFSPQQARLDSLPPPPEGGGAPAPKSIPEFVQSETDGWIGGTRMFGTVAVNIARERFGNDTAILYLAGEVTALEAGRLLADDKEAQVDTALTLAEARDHLAEWWRQELT
jgi:hypothetical protein